MRICVLGAGGVGCWIAGRLALARPGTTSLLARGKTLRALQDRGLQLRDAAGAPIAQLMPEQLPVHASPSELEDVNVLFVTVKTHQLETCVPLVASILRAFPAAVVVPFLNGVEATQVLRKGLTSAGLTACAANVAAGIAKCITYMAEPATCVLQLEIGLLMGATEVDLPDAAADTLAATVEACEEAGLHAQAASSVAHMRTELWRKFLITGCIGPVTAATRAPVDVVLDLPETRVLTRQAMEEMCAVAQALGVDLSNTVVEDTLAVVRNCQPGSTYSTTRDILSGRKSELFEFCGAVVRLGAQAGVATPVHSQLLATLLPQERVARGELSFELQGM